MAATYTVAIPRPKLIAITRTIWNPGLAAKFQIAGEILRLGTFLLKPLDPGVTSRLYAQEWVAERALQIGRVALKTGLSVDAIRFYEKEGLLPRPARTPGGYRLYLDSQVADLEFIQRAQQPGFSLGEIRQLFSIQRHPQEVCVHVRDLIAQKLVVVRGKIKELQLLETGLTQALKQCRKALRQPANHRECCPALEEISAARIRKKKR